MKIRIFFAVITSVILAVLSPGTASAAKGMKRSKAKPTPVPEKVAAGSPTIISVSNNSISIEQGKTKKTYAMSSETHIVVDGRPALSTDLKSGMHAVVGGSSLNPTLALSVQATTPSASAPKKK